MSYLVKESFWDTIQRESKTIELNISPIERKRTGSYYTHLSLTDVMMNELTAHITKGYKPIWEYRFLEPCVGTGNFVFSYLKCAFNYGLTEEEATVLLNNIYVADINREALSKYKELLSMIAENFWGIELDEEYFDKHIGGGLLIDVTSSELKYSGITDVFSKDIVGKGFDIIVTNPPYKNLKAERVHYSTEEQYENDKKKYNEISKYVTHKFKYSTRGVLNLYKLFVEEIIDNYSAKDAYISLLLPSSILSDKSCENLRTHIILNNSLKSIKIIGENSKCVDAQQSLAAVLIKKGTQTKTVNIVKDFIKHPLESVEVDINDIINPNTGNAIIPFTRKEYDIYKKLKCFPCVKDLSFIKNLRGELDLTANKDAITQLHTEYKLLRGRNLDFYQLRDMDNPDYVSEDFVNSTKKRSYILTPRIACQQIANMNKERRVTFAYVPEMYVLGNSCNFICVDENDFGIDIFTLLGLFNTEIINRYFKLTSSNNHVNNYEIDCFPVPVNSIYLRYISKLTKAFLNRMNGRVVNLIEKYAQIAYGLTDDCSSELEKERILLLYYADISKVIPNISLDAAESILSNNTDILNMIDDYDTFAKKVVTGITDKYTSMYNGYILNHTTFKLSDLDLEMIKNVPQGGSWRDIPKETVEKSSRLKRISKTGGRTTLYGRIDYDKPSYTITTYFNRPGNGTYVHPTKERVLSVREAARFQCFKDDYYFFGNKTQLLKQVGNAVPTVLAYQIARQIIKKTGCKKSVDLFCGAGGMTAGFKEAGINSIISNDIEESACVTLKINNPEINVLCGDITKEETKQRIVDTALANHADTICGGPPCQGFSMAGLRLDDDPRNRLFLDFVDIVARINPKVIVFENVEGLLSYNNGQTYMTIHNMFAEIGYLTEGRTLLTSNYAVPQKRRRVIILCVREDLNISPAALYPEAITEKPELQITARDTIFDLDSVECGETAKYLNVPESDIVSMFKGNLTYYEYIKNHTQPKSRDVIIQDDDGQLLLNLG